MSVPNRNWSYPTAIKFGVGRISELAEQEGLHQLASVLFEAEQELLRNRS